MKQLLPGVRIDKGYVQVRIMHAGRYYCKNFGRDSDFARGLANMHASEKRKEILMGKAGIAPKVAERQFKDVVPLYMEMWQSEKNGDGTPKHSHPSISERQRVFNKVLVPYFGKMLLHEIRTADVEKWREKCLSTGMLGTSVNRYMVPLGDMFFVLERAIANETITPFQLPAKNPCTLATKAELRKRDRILTEYELRKLHNAFTQLNDQDGWEICLLLLQSVLSPIDLRKLSAGDTVDLARSKSGVAVNIPLTLTKSLNWINWAKRSRAALKLADLTDVQLGRDLRKTGGNKLVGSFDIKLVSQYYGHASQGTTERIYTKVLSEKMRPLADYLVSWTKAL